MECASIVTALNFEDLSHDKPAINMLFILQFAFLWVNR